MSLTGIPAKVCDSNALRNSHLKWIEKALANGHREQEKQWTQSLSVGNRRFADGMKRKPGMRAKYRSFEKVGPAYRLHEDPTMPCSAGCDPEIDGLRGESGCELHAFI